MKPKLLPLLLACLAAGCASTKGVDTRGENGEPPKPFSRIATESRWVPPSELEGAASVIVALVDLDFSKRDTEIVCTPASFRPSGNDVRLAVFEEGRRVRTIAELRDVLAERTDGTPIGLVVMADGKALGAGAEVSPEMRQFLRYFIDQLDRSGVEFAILAPSRVSVVRVSRPEPDEPAEDSSAPRAERRSAVYDIPPR